MDVGDVIPVVIGGGISLVSSLLVFGLAVWIEARRREREAKLLAASNACVALAKLSSLYSSLHSVDITLDEIFKEATENERMDMAPGVKVTPLAGLPETLPSVNPGEIMFLLREKKSRCYQSVLRFELRAHTVLTSLKTFNGMRQKYQEDVASMILNGADASFSACGQETSFQLKGPVGAVFSAREGVLNSLIGQIIEDLDGALQIGQSALSEYQAAAHAAFGKDFPVASIGFGDHPC